MDGLAALGFWLMVGMVLAAGTVSSALKERDKERERQATLRALLEKEGQSVTDILAYMRERDALEVAVYREAMGLNFLERVGKRLPALAVGLFAIALGVFAFAALRYGVFPGTNAVAVPLVSMLGIWAAGLALARRMWRSSSRIHDASPDA